MDQIRIGKFIAERRRLAGLTQMQLAEKMDVTDRAVSKWENGRAMPDSSIMLALCDVLGITVNDLLCGEVVSVKDYNEKNEQVLLELAKQKEEADRRLLAFEIVIGTISVLFLLTLNMIAAYIEMQTWLQITLAVSGFVVGLIGIAFAIRIEQVAGYYECKHCGHKYVPKYAPVLFAMHMGRTRYMKCPKCGKHSWQRKAIGKD